MANTVQARKRVRQATERRQRNVAQRSLVRTHIKNVQKAIAANDLNGAQEAFKVAVPVIDRMAGTGQIHRNKAARHKSRLNAQIKHMAQAS